MNQFEQLDQLIKEHGGTIQTFQVLEAGISKPTFYAYVKEKGLEQAAHGIYVSPDAWTDAMYLLHLRCGQAVFSHETALFFHDLTDREPLKYSITVQDRLQSLPIAGGRCSGLYREKGAARGRHDHRENPSAMRCRSTIWSGQSVICYAAGAILKSRCFRMP